MSKTYDNTSISALKGADRVRLKPSVVFGSDTLEGCEHAVFEILSNSIDEARDGYGNKIILTKYLDGSISVEDFGRGIPMDWNPNENEYNYKLLFEEMYAGGKYKNDASDNNYEFSLGLNGLGLCATQYTSEYMEATSKRDGYIYKITFKEGKSVGGLSKQKTKDKTTGTFIKWKPDIKVFTEVNIPTEYFENVLKQQSIVNSGIFFIFKNEKEPGLFDEKTYFYENGIVDYIKEKTNNNNLCEVKRIYTEREGSDRDDRKTYKLKIEAAFTFNPEIQLCEYFHNSSFLEYGGAPDKAIKSALPQVFDEYIRRLGKYNKNEEPVSFQDISDCLVLVINSFSSETSYENQTKKSINNKFIQDSMTDFFKSEMEAFLVENQSISSKIVEQILINKRSRESAEKSKLATRKKLSANITIQNRVEKFVDCRTKDVSKRELFIVEGDSALGSCKLARCPDYQGIMPIRGKILNCLKSDMGKILKSDIIMDLMKVFGCGIEMKNKNGKGSQFDINSLRWDKIIILTDGDVDGYQIRTLVLTMIYRLTPSLISEGKVYIAETPLYEITYKGKSCFAYSDAEKNKICSRFAGKYEIARSKGLGENNPDMMWNTTMDPENRRLIQITPDDAQKTSEIFDLLLGDNLQGRKRYIEENGHLYLGDLDLE